VLEQVYGHGMSVRRPAMSERQLEVQERVVRAIAEDDFGVVAGELDRLVLAERVWLPPPLLAVAAALIGFVVESEGGPWEIGDDLWERLGPDRMPSGRSQWRNASYAVHAAGCLAGGVWLDVGRQESFWRLPLWPFAFDLVELLSDVARQRLGLSPRQLAEAVTAALLPVHTHA
jgi:hypothetical protein